MELGRVDILLETALMSTYMAMPRTGHLNQLYQMFGYLKAHPKRKLAYDAQHPRISEKIFKQYNWFDFYHDSKEAIPDDMPKPRGNSMSTHCFVDASHGRDQIANWYPDLLQPCSDHMAQQEAEHCRGKHIWERISSYEKRNRVD